MACEKDDQGCAGILQKFGGIFMRSNEGQVITTEFISMPDEVRLPFLRHMFRGRLKKDKLITLLGVILALGALPLAPTS
ncbi:MAG TPA: hypothetical protein VEX38_03545 [Fimbriimonadaceae bacterium]|nr:hypothetical protein [Fimbriimonadaceae bacterium]